MCDAGATQGYIVNIKTGNKFGPGEQTTTDSLVYSFGERRTRRRLDISTGYISELDNNSILYNDIGYRLATVQYANTYAIRGHIVDTDQLYGQPAKGWKSEVIMAFTKINAGDVGEPLILLRFPIFIRGTEQASDYPVSQDVSTYLKEAAATATAGTIQTVKSLAPFFTEGITGKADNGYWTYVSCYDASLPRIRTFLFPGHIVNTDAVSVAAQPVKVHGTGTVLLRAEVMTEISRAIYLTKKPIASGTKKATADINKAIYQYKCMPIDMMKDVGENSTLRIDPTTGESLADVVATEKKEMGELLPTMNADKVYETLNTIKTILIILVVAIGVSALFFLMYKLFKITPATPGVPGATVPGAAPISS